MMSAFPWTRRVCIGDRSLGAGKQPYSVFSTAHFCVTPGEILVSGVHFEAAGRRQRRAIQATIGTIYQDYALVENATCRQNVLNACLPDMAFLPAVCGLFGKARIAAADALLERVGLLDKVDEPVKSLSRRTEASGSPLPGR